MSTLFAPAFASLMRATEISGLVQIRRFAVLVFCIVFLLKLVARIEVAAARVYGGV